MLHAVYDLIFKYLRFNIYLIMRISKELVEAAEYFEDILKRKDFDVESLFNEESTTHVKNVIADQTKDNKVQLV